MTVAKTRTEEDFGRGQIGKGSKERFKDNTGASKFGSSQRSEYMCIWFSLTAQKLSPSKFKYIRNMQQTEVWEGAVERKKTEFSLTGETERESQCYPNIQNAFSQLELQPHYICKNMLLFAIYFSRT